MMIKKNLYSKCIIFTYFGFLVSMCCASQQNTATQNLISALNGEGYFYGIGVTRETNNYRSLYNGETYIVMFVLKKIFGENIEKSRFIADFRSVHQEELRRFQTLRERADTALSTEMERIIENTASVQEFFTTIKRKLKARVPFKTMSLDDGQVQTVLCDLIQIILEEGLSNQFIEGVKAKLTDFSAESTEHADKLNRFVKGIKSIVENHTAYKNAMDIFLTIVTKEVHTRVDEHFSENEKFLLIIARAIEKDPSGDLSQHYHNFYDEENININYDSIEENLTKLVTKIGDLRGIGSLIIFNEMFFSKNAPLDPVDISKIQTHFINLSKLHKNVILVANFLEVYKENFSDISKKMISIDAENELYQNCSDKTDSFFAGAKEWREYFDIIRGNNDLDLHRVQNVNNTYWNGDKISFYQKSSYKNEANNNLLRGHLYDIGIGQDVLTDVNPSKFRMQKMICDRISSEICYDLEIGMRKAFSSYPSTPKIHIVNSNILPIDTRCIKNLPDNDSIIFHVDPEHSEILSKNLIKFNLNNSVSGTHANPHVSRSDLEIKFQESIMTSHSPFIKFKILLNDNIFNFSFWELNQIIRYQ